MVANIGLPSDGKANQGWKLYLTSLIMILCAGLAVLARVYTRRAVKLKADDYTIIASLIFSIVLSVNIQLAVVHGYGKHKVDLTKHELQTCLKFFWVAQTPYKIVVALNKISVIFLYMRIFIGQRFRWLCYGALAIVVSSGIATVFATVFQCVPIEKSWNKNIQHGMCIDSSSFWLANAVLNISTDVIVLALPIREVAKLQLRLRDKVMLHSLFLLGGFVTLTSILRVTAVANSVRNQQDQTWNFVQRGIWTLIEANLGIICACLIVLKGFFANMFGASKPNPTGDYRYGGSGAAGHTGSSGVRELASFRSRQHHFQLEDTIDDDDPLPPRRSYHMNPLAGRGVSTSGGRESDERQIISSTYDVKRGYSQSSVGSVDGVAGWSPRPDQASGIMKKMDGQADSHPTSLANEH